MISPLSPPLRFSRCTRGDRGSHQDFWQPCELVCVGCGGSWPAFWPVPSVLPNRGFILPRSWVFRRTRPAEQSGFAFFLGGCQHRRPSDRTGRYIQVDALDFFSFVAPGRRWKVFCSWLCTWLERFIRVLASGSLVRVCSSIARSLEIKSSTAAGSCGPVQGFAPGLHR